MNPRLRRVDLAAHEAGHLTVALYSGYCARAAIKKPHARPGADGLVGFVDLVKKGPLPAKRGQAYYCAGLVAELIQKGRGTLDDTPAFFGALVKKTFAKDSRYRTDSAELARIRRKPDFVRASAAVLAILRAKWTCFAWARDELVKKSAVGFDTALVALMAIEAGRKPRVGVNPVKW